MTNELLQVLAKASVTQLALGSLRSKDVSQALELLEIDLDASVIALSRLSKEVPPSERESAISALQSIRTYRRIHPRRVEADLDSMASGLLVRASNLGRDRADKILGEIE